jgi:hypothetical protein
MPKYRINTLFSLFHQEKKDINDADQLWGIRNLTDFRRHAQYCSFPPVIPAKFQPPGQADYRSLVVLIDATTRVALGSVAAAGESILSVCTGELIDDGRCKI